MQRILTAAEMREADRLTIAERGIPGLILMENAAAAVVSLLVRRFSPIGKQRVAVLCGKGNNGGDGLAAARQLWGRRPPAALRVVLFAEPDSLRGDAAANWRMLQAVDFEADVVTDVEQWRAIRGDVLASNVLVDALLGTGLTGPARGLPAAVIADMRAASVRPRIVAVDLPSGTASDNGRVDGPAMPADNTVAFTAPKIAQVFPPACERMGRLSVASIGTARSVVDGLPGPRLLLTEAADIAPYTAARDRSSHKGSYGHVLAIGGSRSKPGAIRMTAAAALRMGAGLTTVATAAGAAGAVVSAAPELMVEPAAETADGSLGPESWRPEWTTGKSVAAVGPGLGVSAANRALLLRIYRECSLPLVIDADGLTALGAAALPRRKPSTVLTPHPGEMSRLTGRSIDAIRSDRVSIAREYAAANRVFLVLKGNRTLVAAPNGDVIVNPTGSPGMATAGAGDILTGMIAGLLAQFPAEPIARTVAAAVYLHGAAGERAASARGEQSMLASDILEFLPAAVRAVRAHAPAGPQPPAVPLET